MPKLYYMVGLPGSGKSAYAKELCDTVYNLTDHYAKMNAKGIRDRNIIVTKFNQQIIDALSSGKDCAVDATNVKAKNRIHFLRHVLRDVACEKICVIMATPYLKCLQDSSTEPKVVDEYLRKWETPLAEEGFDEVWVHYDRPEWQTCNGDALDMPTLLADYNQETPNHMWSLGHHLSYTYKCLRTYIARQDRNCVSEELSYAAILHDVGKIFTKSYDENLKVRYFSHNNVGGYESLFFDCGDADKAYVSALICHHMDPYFWTAPNQEMKFIRNFGNDFYLDIMALHGADREAH